MVGVVGYQVTTQLPQKCSRGNRCEQAIARGLGKRLPGYHKKQKNKTIRERKKYVKIFSLTRIEICISW